MILRKLWKKKGAERAPPEIARQHYLDTLARDKVVQEVVVRERRKVVENNFGPRIHRAYGGLK